MLTDEAFEFEVYLRPYVAPASVEAYRRQFPRWRSRLLSLGIDRVPPFPARSPEDDTATNHLLLFIKQGADHRDPEWEHNQRNLTGVRPFKP